MRTLKLKNGLSVKIYSSIDELPIVNFQKFNKFMLIDSGLGSDVESIDEHITTIAKYINGNDKANAIKELQNMRMNMHMIISNISPKQMAFAALIHSINGEEIKDYSDEGLKDLIEKINKTSYSKFAECLAWIKKKLQDELETYFPNDFSDVKEKEAYDKLKKKVQLQLDSIINEIEHVKEIEEIETFMFSLHKPKSFVGSESIEIKYDKQFESACTIISQKANLNAKKMTVLQFYNTLNDIKRQAEAEAKAYKKHKR